MAEKKSGTALIANNAIQLHDELGERQDVMAGDKFTVSDEKVAKHLLDSGAARKPTKADADDADEPALPAAAPATGTTNAKAK